MTPQVGDSVQYCPSTYLDEADPLAAIVTYVHADGTVDLFVPSPNVKGVKLIQGEDKAPKGGNFCVPMPTGGQS
jgi:hypothetical protein